MGMLLLLAAALSLYVAPVLNPATYRSTTDAFTLEVDPSEPDGRGPGRYRLTRHGETVWEREHPFTFFDAGVANDGRVAGVAYSLGIEGGGLGADQGDLGLVVLTASGDVLFENVMARRWSRVIHGLPVPQSKGVLLDEVNNRVLMRLLPDGTSGEEWWFYDLSTGERLQRFDPSTIENSYLADLRRLTEGSLLLAHWESQTTTRYRILTPELESLWTYEVVRTQDSASSRASIITAVTPAGFTIAAGESGELIDFTVTPDGKKFRITESGRRPAPRPADSFGSVSAIQLPLLGTVDLEPPEPNPFGGVYKFDVDGGGRLGFVPCKSDNVSLTVVDREGGVVATVPLGQTDGKQTCFLVAWLGEDAWVAAARNADGDVARLFAVDVKTRQVRPFAVLDGAYLSSLRSSGGRGVLVLHGLSDVLRRLDPRGAEVARLRENYNDERALFSPTDVTALPDGGFAVLDVIRHLVQRFGPDGSYVDAIDLESALGKAPGYPAILAASPDGELAIWDSGAAKPLVRLTNGGALIAERVPRYDDGRPTGRLHDLRYGPDGALWATDGEALLRLNEDGVVDAIVGKRPEKTQLTAVTAAARDAKGRFYLLDRRTASIHVFDSKGTFSHRCDPAPGDFDEQVDSAQISVSGDGTVYLSNETRKGYLVFDAEGRRVERRQTRLDDINEDWYADPRGSDLWITTMEDLFLTDARGNVLHRSRRHGDRTWLDSPAAAAVASDGTVALLTRQRGYGTTGASLGVFTVDGEAVVTKHFPALNSFASIAFETGVIVLGAETQLLILDGGGEPMARFTPESGYDRSSWSHFLTDEGRVLELLDTHRRRVYRYDLSVLK